MTNTNKVVLAVAALLSLAAVGSFLPRSQSNHDLSVKSSEYTSGEGLQAQNSGVSVDKNVAGEVASTVPGVAPRAMAAATDSQTTARMVIKTGQLNLLVKDVRDGVAKISNYALSHNGFVVTSQVSQSDISPSGSITIRIPAQVFDSGFTDVKALGDVQSESVTGQDVSDQYVDLNSRLRTLQATETQLLEIMRRAVKISDVLEVQTQLTLVRGNIESLQGQIKFLKESADMSSLTVYLATDPSELPVRAQPSDQWKPLAVAKEALRNLLEVAKLTASLAIWFVIFIPLWALIAFVLWLAVRAIKRLFNGSKPAAHS